jgi:hypothetical protein
VKQKDTFQIFWLEYRDKSVSDRKKYFSSLSRREQNNLIKNLFKNGWQELLAHDLVHKRLEKIKNTYGLDLVNKKSNQESIFLLEKYKWIDISKRITEFDCFYNTSVYFKDLNISQWGNKNQFFKITFKK